MIKRVITTSAVDCPDNCGIIATVKDGRLIKLEGNPEHGYTKGFLCKKKGMGVRPTHFTHLNIYAKFLNFGTNHDQA